MAVMADHLPEPTQRDKAAFNALMLFVAVFILLALLGAAVRYDWLG